MVPHAQPHWRHQGMKDAWCPLPHLCLHQQYQDLSQGKRIRLIAQSNTSEAVAHISSATSQGTECHQIAISSNLCLNKIHGKVAIVDFRLAQFKLQCTWDVTTGFPLLYILSSKYEFILSYRTRTQRTLKKTTHTPNRNWLISVWKETKFPEVSQCKCHHPSQFAARTMLCQNLKPYSSYGLNCRF